MSDKWVAIIGGDGFERANITLEPCKKPEGTIANSLPTGRYGNISYIQDNIKLVVQSMRPYQWYKNLVIFIGIIFSHNLFSIEKWQSSLFAFIVFCLISGSIYIINDARDVKRDQLHPKKRLRPIASGRLSSRTAIVVAFLLLSGSLLASFFVSKPLVYIEFLYIFINFLYTFYLKSFFLIDIIVIAVGFILRALAGCLVIDVRVSPWLILCVFLMAFVLAIGKRRHDLLISSASTGNLPQYTEKRVESLMKISMVMLLMSYVLYSFFVDIYLMISLPFAFYGLSRFMHLVYLNNFGGEAELILKDRPSLANLILWTVSVVVILYGAKL